jgi:hypothetical protein
MIKSSALTNERLCYALRAAGRPCLNPPKLQQRCAVALTETFESPSIRSWRANRMQTQRLVRAVPAKFPSNHKERATRT